MRWQPKALLLCVVLALVLRPVQAQAWFGWLDDLSGPGKFRGYMYELRVLCFGEKENYKSFHDYLVNLRNPSEVSNGALSGIELNRKLQDLLTEQERFQKTFPVGQRPTDFRQKLSQGVSGLKDKLR